MTIPQETSLGIGRCEKCGDIPCRCQIDMSAWNARGFAQAGMAEENARFLLEVERLTGASKSEMLAFMDARLSKVPYSFREPWVWLRRILGAEGKP